MAMELTFLGTGAAYPSPQRGSSSLVLRHEGNYWMFDCGEGTQTQLMRSDVRLGRISKVFITHLHGDHMFGLPGLICSMSISLTSFERQPLEFYGPKGLRKFLRTSLQVSRAHLNVNYIVHELVPHSCQLPEDYNSFWDECDDDSLHPNEILGSTIVHNAESESWPLYEDDQLKVVAGIIHHRVPCFGFVVEEKPSVGKLDAKKLQSKGIPPGKLYAKIKAGESIESPTGEIIHPSDVLGPSQPGRKIAILGDTYDGSRMTALCNNATLLVHECTLSNEMSANAIEKGHSTPEMAATFACSVNAQNLVLTHFSQRYKMSSDDPENCITLLREQALKTFDCSSTKQLIMAEDLMVITIKKQQEHTNVSISYPSEPTMTTSAAASTSAAATSS